MGVFGHAGCLCEIAVDESADRGLFIFQFDAVLDRIEDRMFPADGRIR